MPLFGKKKDSSMEMPEVVDFSNDTWSYKGEAPVYQIQSDGFSYDIVDADGNDKNAISLGLAGMLVIVLNAKSPKIREDELLPQFGKVIKTRNWHQMTVKEANFLVQTAIKKLTSSATSGDVFDLASYAPLEVKRSLLKTLFTITRTQMKPEFREEAEHRIIDDIVPDIFANPEYELALLTGLIVKPDAKTNETASTRMETTPMLDPDVRVSSYSEENAAPEIPEAPRTSTEEVDSAFAELQKIYGRRVDSAPVKAAVQAAEAAKPATPVVPVPTAEPTSVSAEPKSIPQPVAPNFVSAQPNNPFAQNEQSSIPQSAMPNFVSAQPNNPFAQNEQSSIPQPAMPNFMSAQPNNPFAQNEQSSIPQPSAPNFAVPQPPMPGYGMQQNPYGNMNQQMPQQGYPQMNPYSGNFPPYPGQMWQQNPQMPQNMANQQMPQQSYPQMWQQNPQMPQYPQNFNAAQGGEGQVPPQYYPGWQNGMQNYPQPQNPQNPQTAENA